jgi:deoxyribodipyrimidine photo-lyase
MIRSSVNPRSFVWFRSDLRVRDNPLLYEARELRRQGREVACVYCFDPRHFEVTPSGARRSAAHRTRFLLECVRGLRQSLRGLDSDLVVARGRPEDVIPSLCDGDSEVLVQEEAAFEESQVALRVEKRLRAKGALLRRLSSGASLYHVVH